MVRFNYLKDVEDTDQNVQLHIGDHKLQIEVFCLGQHLINDQEARTWSGYIDRSMK